MSSKPRKQEKSAARLAMEAEVRGVGRTRRGPLSAAGAAERDAALTAGDHEGARAIDAQQRTPCGADFNDVVCAGPFDGQEHPYACPACGVTGVYRAPLLAE